MLSIWTALSPVRHQCHLHKWFSLGVIWRALAQMRGWLKRSWKFRNNQATSGNYWQDIRITAFLLFLLPWIQPPNYMPNGKFVSLTEFQILKFIWFLKIVFSALKRAWNYWNKNERAEITIFYKIPLSSKLYEAFYFV